MPRPGCGCSATRACGSNAAESRQASPVSGRRASLSGALGNTARASAREAVCGACGFRRPVARSWCPGPWLGRRRQASPGPVRVRRGHAPRRPLLPVAVRRCSPVPAGQRRGLADVSGRAPGEAAFRQRRGDRCCGAAERRQNGIAGANRTADPIPTGFTVGRRASPLIVQAGFPAGSVGFSGNIPSGGRTRRQVDENGE